MTEDEKKVEELAYELCKRLADDFHAETPEYFKNVAKSLIESGYRKSPSDGLVELDEENLFELISAFNTRNPDRFYDPKAMNEDRELALMISEKYGRPKSMSVEEIESIVFRQVIINEYKTQGLGLRIAQALKNAQEVK